MGEAISKRCRSHTEKHRTHVYSLRITSPTWGHFHCMEVMRPPITKRKMSLHHAIWKLWQKRHCMNQPIMLYLEICVAFRKLDVPFRIVKSKPPAWLTGTQQVTYSSSIEKGLRFTFVKFSISWIDISLLFSSRTLAVDARIYQKNTINIST